MKCTYCNGEHPDGFKFCPVTGKEIVQSKKACTNPGCVDFEKYILPSDALFCPRCGIKIDDFRAIQTKNVIETSEDNSSKAIDTFFPVSGAILGKQCNFDSKQFLNYSFYDDEDDNYKQYAEGQCKQGGLWTYDFSRRCYIECSIGKKDGMFSEWAAKGFNMEMSYDSWCELLLRLGFQFEPFKIDYERVNQTLIAVAPDNSFRFELCFRFTDLKTMRKLSKDSCGTLGWICATVE